MNAKTFASILLTASLLAGCDLGGLFGPSVGEVRLCEQPKGKEGCEEDTSTFGTTTPKIFVTAILNGASEGTKVQIDWRLLEGKAGKNIKLYGKQYTTKADEDRITTALAPAKTWQPGTYQVAVSMVGQDSEPVTKEFQVK